MTCAACSIRTDGTRCVFHCQTSLDVILVRMTKRLERIDAISRALGVDNDEVREKLMVCLRQLAVEQREDSEAIIAWGVDD